LAGVINTLAKVAAERAPEIDLQIVCAAKEQEAVDRFIDVVYEFEPIQSGFAKRNLFDIPRAARRCNADLVVSQYVRPLFSDCATFSVIHDVLFLDYPESFSWTYRTIRKMFFYFSARKSTFVSTVSAYSADRIAYHFGIDRSAILVIPNAVDPAFANSERSRADNDKIFRLLSVSRLERRKRHEWGIDALEALRSKGIDASFRIIGEGDGEYAQGIKKAVAIARDERGLDVTLSSGLDFSALVQAYADTDLFLCPSLSEGFGIPVIEAGAAGVPCVITNGGALAELDGQFCGFTVHPDDHAGFIDRVCALAIDIERQRLLAGGMRLNVSRKYSWDNAAQAYVDVIQGIARRTK
jgi:glycosyltransferase involved in cell wall biosynthesis